MRIRNPRTVLKAALLLSVACCMPVTSEPSLDTEKEDYFRRLSCYVGSIDESLRYLEGNMNRITTSPEKKSGTEVQKQTPKLGSDVNILDVEPVILGESSCGTGRNPRFPTLSPEQITDRLRIIDSKLDSLHWQVIRYIQSHEQSRNRRASKTLSRST